MGDLVVRRLGRGDLAVARETFAMMVDVSDKDVVGSEPLSDDYLDRELAAAVGIQDVFVPADNDDTHALDFYRAQGAVESPVTHFTFTAQ
jgi:hypothetical protein